MASPQARYSNVALILHWAMAALIIFMIWLGHNMENHEARFQLHKSIGVTLLVLTIARIVWRLFNRPPPLPADVKPLEAKLSKLVQLGFYVLMLLIPLGGWLMVSVSPFTVPTVLFETISWPHLPIGRDEDGYKYLAFLHGKGATFGFLGLLTLHVAGAIKHQIGHETSVLKRILPSQNSKAVSPARGGWPTLLISLGFFMAVISGPLLFRSSSTTNIQAASTPHTITQKNIKTPNWAVDYNASQIFFDFTHDGGEYTGEFKNWDTKIYFDETDLSTAYADVSVNLGTATTGKKLYDDSLRAPEWFSIKSSPQAVLSLTAFRQEGDAFLADAALTLKDNTITVPFSFTLNITDDKARMSGTTTLNRTELNLGQDSDPDADWVSETILVKVSLEANRLSSAD